MTPAPISVERLRELQREMETSGTWEAERDFQAAALEALPALLQQLAERGAEVGRLRNGAEREQLSLLTQLREAERAREEACGLLRKAWRILDIDAPNDKTTDDIAAFLAASGGKADG